MLIAVIILALLRVLEWRRRDESEGAGCRSPARSCHGALLKSASATLSNAPASLSSAVSRFVSSSVPPTGADKGPVQSECPHRLAVPFVVTNRGEKRSRAGRALAVGPLAAACDACGSVADCTDFCFEGEPFRERAGVPGRPVECRAWRGRLERISLLLCSPGPHGPTAIDCPGNVPQSIAVRLPLRLVVFAGVRPFFIRRVTGARSL